MVVSHVEVRFDISVIKELIDWLIAREVEIFLPLSEIEQGYFAFCGWEFKHT